MLFGTTYTNAVRYSSEINFACVLLSYKLFIAKFVLASQACSTNSVHRLRFQLRIYYCENDMALVSTIFQSLWPILCQIFTKLWFGKCNLMLNTELQRCTFLLHPGKAATDIAHFRELVGKRNFTIVIDFKKHPPL